jgi:pyridoxal phosphate enzyme (YggS family)
MSIQSNLSEIRQKLPHTCQLIAVSKRKPASDILEAYNAGQREFGENYIQELVDKKNELPADIHWHFIGHLQRNKVKYIAPFVHLIHAVDSIKLLQEINKQAEKCGRKIAVLLQIHIAQEETKFGFTADEFNALVDNKAFDVFNNIELKGLMAMASNTDDKLLVNNEFAEVKSLFELAKKTYPSMTEISTGMSKDFELAVKNGSTYIRLGTSIFGQRD